MSVGDSEEWELAVGDGGGDGRVKRGLWARTPMTLVSVFPRASRLWVGTGSQSHKLLGNTCLLVSVSSVES